MSELPARVLVVDDDPQVRETLTALLSIDFEVAAVGGVATAEAELSGREFDVVLTDYDMPGGNGLKLVELVHQRFPGLLTIVLTGHPDLPALKGAESDDAVLRVLSKPYDPRRLTGLIQSATRLSRMRRATAELKKLRTEK